MSVPSIVGLPHTWLGRRIQWHFTLIVLFAPIEQLFRAHLGTNPVPSGHATWWRQIAVRAELPQHVVTETGPVVWGENERRLGGIAGQGILGARIPLRLRQSNAVEFAATQCSDSARSIAFIGCKRGGPFRVECSGEGSEGG